MPTRLGGEKAKRLQSYALTNEVRLDATQFAEHDVDGNVLLDFEEFYAMQMQNEQIRKTRTLEEIREWFDVAGGGKDHLTANDFFRFSLSKAAAHAGGSALRESFKRWDRDKTGYLDAVEFGRAAQEMGFGAVAHTLFKTIDDDNSGAISYDELEATLIKSATGGTPGTRELVTSLVWKPASDGVAERASTERSRAAPALDVSLWKLTASDVPSLRAELQGHLVQSGAHVADVIKLFDKDVGSALSIDDVEFHKAIRELFGYKGSKWTIDALFRSLDADGNGEIGFDEMVCACAHALASCSDATTRPHGHAPSPPRPASSLSFLHGLLLPLSLDQTHSLDQTLGPALAPPPSTV